MTLSLLIAVYLPWLLSALTIATMWLAGSRWPGTWLLSLGNQALWLVWICVTATWGLLPMNLAMWVVCTRNHKRWAEERVEQEVAK